MIRKTTLFAAALGVAFVFGGTATARANDRNCAERIRSEQWQLERDIARHGFLSRQTQHRRGRIARLERECSFRSGFDTRRGRRFDDRFLLGRRNQRGFFLTPALRGRGRSCNRGRRF